MIPEFPVFKKIEIGDKQEIEEFTKNYPPYSDFNFISLFCWDVDDKRQVSLLNGNLIVLSTDDQKGRSFLSFLGTNKVEDTVSILISYCKENKIRSGLQMITEEAIKSCCDSKFAFAEDRNNFDYVYSVKDLVELQGKKYSEVRHQVNRFLNKYKSKYRIERFDLGGTKYDGCLSEIFEKWVDVREAYSEREDRAFNKLVKYSASFQLINLMLFVDNEPVGFLISQPAHDNYIVAHFAKSNYEYCGVSAFLLTEAAKIYANEGYHFVNYEEDLGLPGLRHAKSTFRPVKYLKKYGIKPHAGLFGKLLPFLYNINNHKHARQI